MSSIGVQSRALWLIGTDGNKSIPQTRLRLQKMMIGLETESGDVEWENEREGDERGKEWMKEKEEKKRTMRKGKGNVRIKTPAKG